MQPTVLDRLIEIGDLFQRDMARAFDGTGLTLARTAVLWVVHGSGPVTQQTLASALDVTPRNVTGLVDALESTGFVHRRPHPTDRRAILVELTESGEQAMATMAREHDELTSVLTDAVAPADRDAFARGLEAVAAKLRDLVAEQAGEQAAARAGEAES